METVLVVGRPHNMVFTLGLRHSFVGLQRLLALVSNLVCRPGSFSLSETQWHGDTVV